MGIWKITAAGDEVYVEAPDKSGAKAKLFEAMGKIPESMLTFTEVAELPEDEELL